MKSDRPKLEVLNRICRRAHYLTTQMIYLANNRDDVQKGDPKVGGHPAACASSLHITGALHLLVKSGFDFVANKPHAAPIDHSYSFLLNLFLKEDLSRFSDSEAEAIMSELRSFPTNGQPVFQSYHSSYDPDHHGFLPSGTVGIPPVNVGYLAHAYRFCKDHQYKVPDAHFWAILGDSEFREGSVYEAIPDFAEREIGNLTWIIDYNRQSLDGHRITNKEIMGGTDDHRIERTMLANGWDVIQLRHGSLRLELFKRPGGDKFQQFLEDELQDYELQALLLVNDMAALKKGMAKKHPHLKIFFESVGDQELYDGLRDLGGHDIFALADAMEKSKINKRKPTLIIAHTVKGWGLRSAAAAGNHSSLPSDDEMEDLKLKQNIPSGKLFAGFDFKSEEGKFLKHRGEQLYSEIQDHHKIRQENQVEFSQRFKKYGEIPTSLGINLKMANYPHTQWMLGQCTAKLTRIANSRVEGKGDQKPLIESERSWKEVGELIVSMAPDVGTSTNLNPAMDGKIFGVAVVPDYETDFGVKDKKTPDLVPGEEASDRFLRFDIAEGNVMSCMGSYGKLRDLLGIPILPLMTVYDFFIKRAHDQYFYNVYWKSSFLLVGTPSGITLSPEGAQHGWKSDLQIPNQITWEPFFCIEMEWILCDAIRRHALGENEGRTGVVIRGVTRGADQKLFMHHLKQQRRFKVGNTSDLLCAKGYPLSAGVDESTLEALEEQKILETVQNEVLAGAYYLIDYRGYAGYEPGDNVIHLFAMGALVSEAIGASEKLLKRGIYANVIVVTSSDLLVGNLGHSDDFNYLKSYLGISSDLIITKDSLVTPEELITVSGRRVPIVSVHDGEPGLLDNLGSIVGVRHEALSVRKHSRCGRPADIYAYHHLDSDSIVEAAGKVLSETALEKLTISTQTLDAVAGRSETTTNWRNLWPHNLNDNQ